MRLFQLASGWSCAFRFVFPKVVGVSIDGVPPKVAAFSHSSWWTLDGWQDNCGHHWPHEKDSQVPSKRNDHPLLAYLKVHIFHDSDSVYPLTLLTTIVTNYIVELHHLFSSITNYHQHSTAYEPSWTIIVHDSKRWTIIVQIINHQYQEFASINHHFRRNIFSTQRIPRIVLM